MGARGPDPRFFDLWSYVYDVPVVQRLTYRPVHDAVVRALRETRPGRVVDVGCGTGLLAARVRREIAGCAVTGCDFSPGMLRHAAGRTRAVAWVQGDACGLPFRAASFDAAVSTEAFHWFPDQDAALAELHRVLAPGGRLFLALINPVAHWQTRLTAAASRVLGEPLRWPTGRALQAAMEKAGFRVESRRFVLRLPMVVSFPTVLTTAVRD